MEIQATDPRLVGQSLRFRQGGVVNLDGERYRMDGTDGQARLMLLPNRTYLNLRGRRANLQESEVRDQDYTYIAGIPRDIIAGNR